MFPVFIDQFLPVIPPKDGIYARQLIINQLLNMDTSLRWYDKNHRSI